MFVVIVIATIPGRPGYYIARCDGRVLCRSRQPLLDGARQLLNSGYPADAVAVMKYASSQIAAVTSTIGNAAGLTASEEINRPPRFKRWKPMNLGDGSPRVALAPVAATPAASMGAAQ